MTHASLHFVCCYLHIKQTSKRIAFATQHPSLLQRNTKTHTPLFPPLYLPSYTANQYDSDCSSRWLPPRQRWPRFQQIIQMTSSRVFLCACACMVVFRQHSICCASCAVCAYVCVIVHLKAFKNPNIIKV